MPARPRERKTSALGGAGSGLGLVSVAHSLPANLDWAKALLEYLAPLASIAVAVAWADVISRYKRRQLMRTLAEARGIRDMIHASPASSEQAKGEAQHDVERVERLVRQLLVSEAEDLAGMDARLPSTESAVGQKDQAQVPPKNARSRPTLQKS
jgi:hypothetical protein